MKMPSSVTSLKFVGSFSSCHEWAQVKEIAWHVLRLAHKCYLMNSINFHSTAWDRCRFPNWIISKLIIRFTGITQCECQIFDDNMLQWLALAEGFRLGYCKFHQDHDCKQDLDMNFWKVGNEFKVEGSSWWTKDTWSSSSIICHIISIEQNDIMVGAQALIIPKSINHTLLLCENPHKLKTMGGGNVQ
jgi:hypothetical protein